MLTPCCDLVTFDLPNYSENPWRSLCISLSYNTEWFRAQSFMWSFHMLLWNIRLQPLTLQVIIFSGHIRTQANCNVAPVLRQKYKLFFT